MADRLFFWKSIDNTQEDCFGIYQGQSEDLIGLLNSSKVAANISIIDVTNSVLSEYGWKHGSMDDEPMTIHVEGCYVKPKTKDTIRKKGKVSLDEDGNTIPKPPRKPSEYNLFVKENMSVIKEQFPHLTHQEAFTKCAEYWKLRKGSMQDSEYE